MPKYVMDQKEIILSKVVAKFVRLQAAIGQALNKIMVHIGWPILVTTGLELFEQCHRRCLTYPNQAINRLRVVAGNRRTMPSKSSEMMI